MTDTQKCENPACGQVGFVAPKSGICLACGYRNKPRFDPEEEKRKQEVEERRKAEEAAQAAREAAERRREELLESLAAARASVDAGDLGAVGRVLAQHERDVAESDDPRLAVELGKLKVDYFRTVGLADQHLAALEALVSGLEFGDDTLAYFYDLGVLLEDAGKPAAANRVFQEFVRHYRLDYRDVTDRLRGTAGATPASGEDGPATRVIRAGGYDLGAETFARWLNEANRDDRCFRDPVLLSGQDEFQEEVEGAAGARAITQEAIRERLQKRLGDKMTITLEQVVLSSDESGRREIPCLLFRPSASLTSLQAGPSGAVWVAAQIIVPQVGSDRVHVYLHVYFQPSLAGEVEDLPSREFNDRVEAALRSLHPIEHNVQVKNEVDGLMREVLGAIQAEIRANSGPTSF